MIQITCGRMALFAAAVATLIGMWFFDASIVNRWFDSGEKVAQAFAVALSKASNTNPALVELVLLGRLHADRAVVVGVLMLAYLSFWHFAIQALRGEGISLTSYSALVVRVVLVLALAHGLLTILMFSQPELMKEWFAGHEGAFRSVLRYFKLARTETFLLKALHLQNFLVTMEMVFLVSTAWSILMLNNKTENPLLVSR